MNQATNGPPITIISFFSAKISQLSLKSGGSFLLSTYVLKNLEHFLNIYDIVPILYNVQGQKE